MASYLGGGEHGGPARPTPLEHPALRDRGMKAACRNGDAVAIRLALRFGASVSTVPVDLVAPGSKPVPLVGGTEVNPNQNPDEAAAVVVKALTLQLAAKGRQIETFSHLISLGARLDEPGTSIASIRSLMRLVTQGRDAPALLRLFFPSGANAPLLARQLSQDMRDDALMALLEGYNSPFPSLQPLSLGECVSFARALLDAGASPNHFRSSRTRFTSTLALAVKTISPDLVRLLLDRGAHPGGPRGRLYPPPVTYPPPLHIPLCSLAHALATSLMDASAQAVLRQIAEILLDRGADINISAPHTQHNPPISFRNPLLVFLDTVDYWDDEGGGLHALDALRFLLDRGSSLDGPPGDPVVDYRNHPIDHWAWFLPGQYWQGVPRSDPCRELLEKWGVRGLASPAFMSVLELLVGDPRRRGGVRFVAESLTAHDYSVPPSSSSDRDPILGAWTRLVTLTIRDLPPLELSRFLYAYVVRMGTCPTDRLWHESLPHRSAEHEMGDLAKATVTVLLAAGADINHRLSGIDSSAYRDDPNLWRPGMGGPGGQTALHALCVWLNGRAREEHVFGRRWRPTCLGCRHTPRRIAFIRFLVETCGADRGATYFIWTPAEMLGQLRRPELDAVEITDDWGSDAVVVEEGRRALVALLETPRA